MELETRWRLVKNVDKIHGCMKKVKTHLFDNAGVIMDWKIKTEESCRTDRSPHNQNLLDYFFPTPNLLLLTMEMLVRNELIPFYRVSN